MTVRVHRDPWAVPGQRPALTLELDRVTPLGEWIYRELPELADGQAIVLVNSEPWSRAEWALDVTPDDQVDVVAIPMGGGGGKNPIAMILLAVLTIAVMWWNPGGWVIAAGFGAAAAGTGAGLLAAGLINAAILVGGSYLINLALPPPAPSHDGDSPTYSINARGNRARLREPIEAQVGRVLSYPGFAAQPWSYFRGASGYAKSTPESEAVGAQILHLLFHVMEGEADVEAILVNGQDIRSMPEVEWRIYEPGQRVKLFPTTVLVADAVQGLDLPFQDQPVDDKDDPYPYRNTWLWGQSDPTRSPITLAENFATATARGVGGPNGEGRERVQWVEVDEPLGVADHTLNGSTIVYEGTPIPANSLNQDLDQLGIATIYDNVGQRIYYWVEWSSLVALVWPKVAGDTDWDGNPVTESGPVWVVTHNNWTSAVLMPEDSADPEIDELDLDFVAPLGLYKTSDVDGDPKGVEGGVGIHYREVDSAGSPVAGPDGLWRPMSGTVPKYGDSEFEVREASEEDYGHPQFVLEGSGRKVVRYTHGKPPYDAAGEQKSGRYQVRCRRTGMYRPKRQEVIQWTGLRGFAATQQREWPGRTMAALRIQANSNFNDRNFAQVGFVATHKSREWIGDVDDWTAPTDALATRVFDNVGVTKDADSTLGRIQVEGIGAWARRGDRVTLSGFSNVTEADADANNQTWVVDKVLPNELQVFGELLTEAPEAGQKAHLHRVRMRIDRDKRAELIDGARVRLQGATAVGGIPADTLNARHEILVEGEEVVSFEVDDAPTDTATGGGAAIECDVLAWTAVHPTRTISSAIIDVATDTRWGRGMAPVEKRVDLEELRALELGVWQRRDQYLSTTGLASVGGGANQFTKAGLVAALALEEGGLIHTEGFVAAGNNGAHRIVSLDDADTVTVETTLSTEGASDSRIGRGWNPNPVKDLVDWRLDQRRPFAEVFDGIARAGRARVVMPRGVVTVVRDQPQAAPRAQFNPFNMAPQGIDLLYELPTRDRPDHLIAEFYDQETWEPDEVVVSLLDPSDPDYPGQRPARVGLDMVTQRKQAWREATYEFEAARRRQRVTALQCTPAAGMLGLLARVEVADPILSAGHQWGRVIGYEEEPGGASATFTMDRPLVWDGEVTASSHALQLRAADGSAPLSGLVNVSPGVRQDQCTMVGTIDTNTFGPVWTLDRVLRQATLYTFGRVSQNAQDLLVTSITSSEDGQVRLECVNYVPEVYEADGDAGYVPPTDEDVLAQPGAQLEAPRDVRAIIVEGGTEARPRVQISWAPVPWAQYYQVEWSYDGGRTWEYVGRVTGTSTEARVPRKFKPTLQVVHSSSMLVRIDVGLGLIFARNPTLSPDPWAIGEFNGDTCRITSGTWAGRVETVIANLTDYMKLGGTFSPTPAAGTTYEILRLVGSTLTISVRAGYMVLGPRGTTTLEISQAGLKGSTSVVSTELGEMAVARSAGHEELDDYSLTRLMGLDADGNLYVRGNVYSQQAPPGTAKVFPALYVGRELEPVDGSLRRFRLPAPVRDGDSLAVWVGDTMLPRLDPGETPGSYEYVLEGTDQVLLGFDKLSVQKIHALMVGQDDRNLYRGLHVATPLTVVGGTYTVTVPWNPIAPEELVLVRDGLVMEQVASSPGSWQFSFDPETRVATVGDQLFANHRVWAIGVENTATATAKLFRCRAFTGNTLPLIAADPVEQMILTPPIARFFEPLVDLDEGFNLEGNPAIDVVWGGTAPADESVKIQVGLVGDLAAAEGLAGDVTSWTKEFVSETTVVCQHNFGRFPLVQVLDEQRRQLIPLGVTHVSVNEFQVTFTAARSGVVVATLGAPGAAATYREVDADTTLAVEDYRLVVSGAAGTVTVTMPAAAGLQGKDFRIKNAGAFDVVIAAADNIEGAATFTLRGGLSQAVTLVSTGATWVAD